MLTSVPAPSATRNAENIIPSAAAEEKQKIDGYSDLAFNMTSQLGHLLPNEGSDEILRYQPSLTFSCIFVNG